MKFDMEVPQRPLPDPFHETLSYIFHVKYAIQRIWALLLANQIAYIFVLMINNIILKSCADG